MRKKPNLIYLQLILVLAVLFLTVYSTYSVVSAKAYQPEINLQETEQPKKRDFSENIKLSKEINEYVKSIEKVSGSVCFVMFDQCYVAFKCENLVETNAIQTLKKEIAEKVCKKFSKINKVFVSNDLNAFIKMENIMNRISAGESVANLKPDIIELRKLFHGSKRMGPFTKRR